jgi:hypothetical protein
MCERFISPIIRSNHRHAGVGGSTPCLFPCYLPALTYELRPIETGHQRLVNSLSRLRAALELIDSSCLQLFVDGLSLPVPVLAAWSCSR